MSFSISLRIFSVTTALLLVCARIWAVSANDLMRNGDVCDVKLQASEALEFYLSAEKLEPQNTRLLVSIARQYRHLMVDAKNREEKLRLGGVALNYAKRAVAMAPNDSQTQLALAISCGKLLPLQGPKEQTEAAHVIKDAADKAIKLDPQNDLAWHVLGRWHMVLAGVGGIKRALAPLFYGKLPDGSNEEAVACFQRAIEINPNRLRHYIELGQTYAQMGRTADARRLFAKGLAMPDVEKDDPEIKLRARETLAKLP